MNFTIEDKGKYSLVKSTVDKLDTTCAPELKSELVYLNKTGVRNVIIDLSDTRYCDSSGLSSVCSSGVGNIGLGMSCAKNQRSSFLSGKNSGSSSFSMFHTRA